MYIPGIVSDETTNISTCTDKNLAVIILLSEAAKSASFTENFCETIKLLDEAVSLSSPNIRSLIVDIRQAIFECAATTYTRINKTSIRNESTSRVYFIQRQDGLVKIGCSNDINARIHQLEGMVGDTLTILCTIPGGKRIESSLHRKFKGSNHHGEWFRPSEDLMSFIASKIVH